MKSTIQKASNIKYVIILLVFVFLSAQPKEKIDDKVISKAIQFEWVFPGVNLLGMQHLVVSILLIGLIILKQIFTEKWHLKKRFMNLPVIFRWLSYYLVIGLMLDLGIKKQIAFIYFQF